MITSSFLALTGLRTWKGFRSTHLLLISFPSALKYASFFPVLLFSLIEGEWRFPFLCVLWSTPPRFCGCSILVVPFFLSAFLLVYLEVFHKRQALVEGTVVAFFLSIFSQPYVSSSPAGLVSALSLLFIFLIRMLHSSSWNKRYSVGAYRPFYLRHLTLCFNLESEDRFRKGCFA